MTKTKDSGIIKLQVNEDTKARIAYLALQWGTNKKDLASDVLEQAIAHTFYTYQELLKEQGNGVTAGAEVVSGDVK